MMRLDAQLATARRDPGEVGRAGRRMMRLDAQLHGGDKERDGDRAASDAHMRKADSRC
jgi:hypothetical protein